MEEGVCSGSARHCGKPGSAAAGAPQPGGGAKGDRAPARTRLLRLKPRACGGRAAAPPAQAACTALPAQRARCPPAPRTPGPGAGHPQSPGGRACSLPVPTKCPRLPFAERRSREEACWQSHALPTPERSPRSFALTTGLRCLPRRAPPLYTCSLLAREGSARCQLRSKCREGLPAPCPAERPAASFGMGQVPRLQPHSGRAPRRSGHRLPPSTPGTLLPPLHSPAEDAPFLLR